MHAWSYVFAYNQHTEEMVAMLRDFFAREEGQGLVEYALLLVFIALVVTISLTLLGQRVSAVLAGRI